MGAGVLPVAFRRGRAYLLFARERIGSKKDSGLWSDFGGKTEQGETRLETAVREAHEESMGLMGNKQDIEELINTSTIGKINVGHYVTYVVEVEYDESIPKLFRKEFLDAAPSVVEMNNGLYEKDKVAWVRSDNVNKFAPRFRKWFRASGIPFKAAALVSRHLEAELNSSSPPCHSTQIA